MQEQTILLADDDKSHRNMLTLLLSDWGYRIREAEDGEAALAAFRESTPDLVLMDVRMPKMDGITALRAMKEEGIAAPVLIMTAYSNVEAAVEAIKLGAYDYLTKPLDFDKLKVSIGNCMRYSSLVEENSRLSSTLAGMITPSRILGKSRPMLELMDLLLTVAPSEATVLITGESGTGKEMAAKSLHEASRRAGGPYVAVNCAALTESLLESELFGHEKGAFTGANRRHEGRFAQANGGTLFLDEIGEMPGSMQVKLLRVIQEREVTRVGGEKSQAVDVRLVAATNRNLQEEVAAGRFREDLYYRLKVVSLHMPPLKDRRDDIPLLGAHFASLYARKNDKTVTGFSPEALDVLTAYSWPGNVRELENCMERAVVLLSGHEISLRELPAELVHAPECAALRSASPLPQRGGPDHPATAPLTGTSLAGSTLEELERAAILQTLEKTGGNKSEAAKILGITRKTLHLKLAKYETERE